MRIIHLGLLLLSLAAGPVSAGELEDKLKAAGVSDDSIKILVEQGKYTSSAQLMLPVERLERRLDKLNIPPAELDLILNLFGQRDQDFAKMNLGELLEYVAGSPNDAQGIKTLRARPEVMRAEAKTKKWAVAQNNKLNPALTVAYLEYLKNAAPDVLFRGQPTTTLDLALGRAYVVREHPMLAETLGRDNFDSKGLDWSKVPEEARKALLWAKMTRDDYFPRNPVREVKAFHREASQSPYGENVQEIVMRYKAALANKQAVAAEVHNMDLP